MKAIILAAGQGMRLRPLINDRPKCMVEFKNKPIIDYIVETMHSSKMLNIKIVTGYKHDVLEKHLSKYENISFYHNKDFQNTNMLHSLWRAKSEFDDDVVISYSDIIYSKDTLQKLMESHHDISVIIDKKWLALWSLRMDDPLQDAESLILDSDDNILEIGKKVNSYDKIQGQYIGLIKISKKIWLDILEFYDTLSKKIDIKNMYMTDFLQKLVNHGFTVKAIPIYGNWLEIDCLSDIKNMFNIKF
jgi:choline kinase